MDKLSKSKTKILDIFERVIGTNNLIKLDRYLGFRGWGLIFYGTLPSSLAFLSITDINISGNSKLSAISIIVGSLLPLVFMFMLIQNGNRKWYLTKDLLYCRSIIITILILIISTSIFYISGMIQGKYIFKLPQTFEELNTIIECFLSATSTIVISSSYFIFALTRQTDLPGLPSLSFENSIAELTENIKKIRATKVLDQFTIVDNSLIQLVEKTEEMLNEIVSSKGNHVAKKSLYIIHEDIENLLKALQDIDESGSKKSKEIVWRRHFDSSVELTNEEKIRRNREEKIYYSTQRLKNLEVED